MSVISDSEKSAKSLPVKVMFVCLGNICRSPTAHAVFEQLVNDAGLKDWIEVSSSGTGDWHIGRSPDQRATAAAKARGYDMSVLRAQQVRVEDFANHHYLLAMDASNFRDLKALCPPQFWDRVQLFLNFHQGERSEVPDPYYGEDDGFQLVLDLVEDASRNLLEDIRQRYSLVAR